jgi:glycosyltransferase involved in cell wall biosynthesis
MTDLPHVTIITPSYNQGRFMQSCIDGVRRQKNAKIEHLIIDNCSTDRTKNIVEDNMRDQTDNYEIIFIHKKDEGHHDAINKGVSMANGDYIGVCNVSDFYLSPSWFQDTTKVMNDHSDVGCVWAMTGDVMEGQEYCIINVGGVKPLPLLSNVKYTAKEYKQFKVGFTELTAIFRKEVLKDLTPMHNGYHPWLYLQYKFYENKNCSVMLNVIASIGRKHDDSISNSYDKEIEKQSFLNHYKMVDELQL